MLTHLYCLSKHSDLQRFYHYKFVDVPNLRSFKLMSVFTGVKVLFFVGCDLKWPRVNTMFVRFVTRNGPPKVSYSEGYIRGIDVEQGLMLNTLFLIACSSIIIWVVFDTYIERTFQYQFIIENCVKIVKLLNK